jgi:hypothetical protein
VAELFKLTGQLNINIMKKIFLMCGALVILMSTACNTSETEKEKGALDSIAATPNPTHTDTLRSNNDTIRTDSLRK